MAFHNIPPNGFPDIPDMEDLEAVVKDVTTLKTSVAGLTSDVTNLNSNKANQITIAPFFNAETSYDPGDIVYYNGLSYRCVNAHEGEWDADDFTATTVAGELATLKSGLNNVSKGKFINPYLETGEFAYWNNYSATYANLDNIDVSGFGGVSDTDANYPSDSDGWGSLVSFCCGFIRLQFYYNWNNSKLYFRSYLSPTWTAWKNITIT